MKNGPIERGDVVLSKAGRDQGRAFVVFDVIDSEYVLLVDGRLRTLDRPKKKKRRHLKKGCEARMELNGHLLDAEREGDVVVDRHVRVQGVVLEHHGDVPVFGLKVVDHFAVDLDCAAGDLFKACYHAQRC